MKTSRMLILGIVAGCLIAGILLMNPSRKDASIQKTTVAPLKVGVETVHKEHLNRWVYGEGRAYATRREYLVFEKSGKVVFIGTDAEGKPLREGSRVNGPAKGERLGQLLVRIDKRDDIQNYVSEEANQLKASATIRSAQASIAQANADLNVARLDYERSKALLKQDAIAKQEVDTKKAAYDNAKAQLSSARASLRTAQAEQSSSAAKLNKAKLGLERTGLFAPFNGTVAYLNVRLGDAVAPEAIDRSSKDRMSKTAPIVLIDPSSYDVEVSLPPFLTQSIMEGQKAYLFFGQTMMSPENLMALPAENRPPHATATVYSITPSISEDSRTVKVTLRTNSGEEFLQDGMLVSAWISDAEKNDALTISIGSLVFNDGKPSIFVLTKDANATQSKGQGEASKAILGTAEQRTVRFGLKGNRKIEVLEGVSEGDMVITEGKHLIVTGSPVRVVSQERR